MWWCCLCVWIIHWNKETPINQNYPLSFASLNFEYQFVDTKWQSVDVEAGADLLESSIDQCKIDSQWLASFSLDLTSSTSDKAFLLRAKVVAVTATPWFEQLDEFDSICLQFWWIFDEQNLSMWSILLTLSTETVCMYQLSRPTTI